MSELLREPARDERERGQRVGGESLTGTGNPLATSPLATTSGLSGSRKLFSGVFLALCGGFFFR